MFLVGVAITLGGVFVLSQRNMTSLKSKQKFRACVHMIVFLKRTQKCRGIEHHWVSNSTKVLSMVPISLENRQKKYSSSMVIPVTDSLVASCRVKKSELELKNSHSG